MAQCSLEWTWNPRQRNNGKRVSYSLSLWEGNSASSGCSPMMSFNRKAGGTTAPSAVTHTGPITLFLFPSGDNFLCFTLYSKVFALIWVKSIYKKEMFLKSPPWKSLPGQTSPQNGLQGAQGWWPPGPLQSHLSPFLSSRTAAAGRSGTLCTELTLAGGTLTMPTDPGTPTGGRARSSPPDPVLGRAPPVLVDAPGWPGACNESLPLTCGLSETRQDLYSCASLEAWPRSHCSTTEWRKRRLNESTGPCWSLSC